MVYEIANAALDHGPRNRPRLRLLLLALARHADEYGFAYPSVETLAEKALCDERTVSRILDELERGGWIAVRRKAVSGRHNAYFMNLAKLNVRLWPSGSCRAPEKQRPRQLLHTQLLRVKSVVFASAGGSAIGEAGSAATEPGVGAARAVPASGVTQPPIGGQGQQGGVSDVESDGSSPIDHAGSDAVGSPGVLESQQGEASGLESFPPIGLARDDGEIPPDISSIPTGHFDHSHRTFCPPLLIKECNEVERQQPPYSVGSFPKCGKVQKPKLPGEGQSAGFEPHGQTRNGEGGAQRERTTASARGDRRAWARMEREAGMCEVAGVAVAAGSVMRACGFTDSRMLQVLVQAMQARLAEDRAAEVRDVEASMVRQWRDFCGIPTHALLWPMSAKKFFCDGIWARDAMWPIDWAKIRRAGTGMNIAYG